MRTNSNAYGAPIVLQPQGSARNLPSSFLLSTGGILRLIMIGVGLLTIILTSIGSPNDLAGRRILPGLEDPIRYEFTGNGAGYIIEPLNVVFIVIYSLTWIAGIVLIPILMVSKPKGFVRRILNRLMYGVMVTFLVAAIICGCLGTYIFWENCCNVTPPCRHQGEEIHNRFTYAEQAYSRTKSTLVGSDLDPERHVWCRCSVTFQQNNEDGVGVSEEKTYTIFVYQPENRFKNVVRATPHHIQYHSAGLVFAFIDLLLHLAAVVFA